MAHGATAPSADAWCANLTDNGDRYIELMTGVYTDNQPDFTYIMPGETKVFTQVWYPVEAIGEAKNATHGRRAIPECEGTVRSASARMPTCERKGAVVRLTLNGKVIL